MRSKSAEKVKLSSFDDLFGKEEPVSGEVVTSVPIDLLHPFKNHPFHVQAIWDFDAGDRPPLSRWRI